MRCPLSFFFFSLSLTRARYDTFLSQSSLFRFPLRLSLRRTFFGASLLWLSKQKPFQQRYPHSSLRLSHRPLPLCATAPTRVLLCRPLPLFLAHSAFVLGLLVFVFAPLSEF